MQTPLSRRYDLKPPLPSASQAPSPAPLQNAALLTRISQMRLPEAAAVMEAIMTLDEGDSELPELCEAFQQRVAEIFNHVQLSTLSSAVDLISTLSDCGLAMLKPHEQLNGILEHRLNYFLSQSARILDARVENSVHSNRNAQGGMLAEFDHLLQCYHHADMLARNGLASLKSVKKAMEHLLRLVESAPLVDLQHRVSELQKTGEVVLEGALLDRLKQVSMKSRSFADMRAVADAVVVMHQTMDLPLFIPELEKILCSELPCLVKHWNLERLQMEVETQAGLQTLTQASSRVWECVNTELGSRLFQWMYETVSNLRQNRGLDKAQAEIGRWKKMTLRAITVGMVVFTSEAKEKIISIFSRCYDDCMGSASFSHAADDIDRMSYQVAMIMGAERRVTLSQPTKAGTLLQSPKPGLPTLKVAPGCA